MLTDFSVFVDEHPLLESCERLDGLRKEKYLTDLQISVEHGTVFAHKIILAARIPFLRDKLDGRMQWSSIADFECAEAIVSYAYTGKLKVTTGNVSKILSCAKDLELDQVLNFCSEFVISRLCPQTLPSIWKLSNDKYLLNLRNSCLLLMQQEFMRLASTNFLSELEFDDFRNLISSDDLRVINEEIVFWAIEKWIEKNDERDDEKLTALMKCIRWCSTNRNFRKNIFSTLEIIGGNHCCLRYLLKVEENIEDSRELFNSNPRREFAQIFLTFGISSSDENWVAAIFDATTGKSTTIARLINRTNATIVSVSKELTMILGGRISGGAISSVELFINKYGQTHAVAPLNFGRWNCGACSVGDDVFVCGGKGDLKTPSSCEVYSLSENRWRLLPDLKEGRTSVAVVCGPDRRIFVIGGEDTRSIALSSMEVCQIPVDVDSSSYDQANFWSNLAPMREIRHGHAAVVFNESIFVAGGYQGLYSTRLSSVEMFPIDNVGGQWISLREEMNVRRAWFSLVATSDSLYAFGSQNSDQNTIERLHVRRRTLPETTSSSTLLSDDVNSAQWELLSPPDAMVRILSAVLMPDY